MPIGSGTGFVIGKEYVLTNRHVVEGGRAFQIRFESEDLKTAPYATVALVSSDPAVDLALLHCKGLVANPIALSSTTPQLSAEVRVLGYPRGELLGTNIKVSRGIVSALPPLRGIPDPKLENSMMHDAATLPGSSGGPVLNQAGLILGVHCAAMGEFKFAVTSNDAIAFSRPIVSDILVEAPRDQPSSTWENTVERLRKSTAQVVVLAESDGIDPIDKDFGEIKWDPYDDPWCMACYGRNTLDCPVRGCARRRAWFFHRSHPWSFGDSRNNHSSSREMRHLWRARPSELRLLRLRIRLQVC